MWVQPESTRKLYICLWVAFISSCVLPYKLMGFMIGETHSHKRSFASFEPLLNVECVTFRVLASGGGCRLSAYWSAGFSYTYFPIMRLTREPT